MRGLTAAAVTLSVSIGIAVGTSVAIADSSNGSGSGNSGVVPRELVVTYDVGATAKARARVRQALKATSARRIFSGSASDGLVEVLKLPAGASVAVAARKARAATAAVNVVEQNYIYHRRGGYPDDPSFLDKSLWGMYGATTTPSSKYGSDAATAWKRGQTGSKQVYVAVIDEGIQATHPDLADNIWTNSDEQVDGVDNDGNGYVDDTQGWDFANNDASVYDPDPTNQYVDAHGTHVAGTIGAVGNNGQGVAGVNWDVSIIPVKFLTWDGGTAEDATRAVDYVTNLKLKKGLNIAAINASWGGPEHPQYLEDAIQRAGKAGIFFVNAVSEGWTGVNSDTTDDYPAKYNCSVKHKGASFNCIVAVTAMNSNGARPKWANYGPSTVDLAAPGTGILSTVPYGDGYAEYDGTSMAAPHVTGAIALYKATYPNASPQKIRSALLGSTIATKDFAGDTVTGGRLDVDGMLN